MAGSADPVVDPKVAARVWPFLGDPGFPLKGSFKGDIEIGI